MFSCARAQALFILADPPCLSVNLSGTGMSKARTVITDYLQGQPVLGVIAFVAVYGADDARYNNVRCI